MTTLEAQDLHQSSPEKYEAFEDNATFILSMLDDLREATKDLPFLRVLDIGGGANTLFSTIRNGQETIIFDPTKPPLEIPGTNNSNSISRVNVLPPGKFDLVVSSFYIHNQDKNPTGFINDLKQFGPSVVAFAEYAFSGTSTEEFKEGFKAEAEVRELNDDFGGDLEECFKKHNKFKVSDLTDAAENNGFIPIKTVSGKGAARRKTYVIAEQVR